MSKTERARILLTDGTVYESASKLALRPAALHFLDGDGAERVVDLTAVQQVSFENGRPPAEGDIAALPLRRSRQ